MKNQVTFFNKNKKRIILFIFVFALLIRLAYSLYQYQHNVMAGFNDDIAYKHFGEQVIAQGPFVTDLKALGTYAGVVGPGMGWILGLIYLVFGSSWIPVFVVNSIIGAITCVLIYHLALQLNDYKIGLLSSFYYAGYLLAILTAPTSGKETWIAFYLVLTIFLLVKIINEKKLSYNLFFLGFLYAFFIHIDERYLFYSPLFLLFLLWGSGDISLRLKKAGIFTGIVLLFMVPWTVRNYIVHGRIILVSVRTNPITEKIFGYSPVKFYDDDYKRLAYLSPERIDSIVNGTSNTYDDGSKIPWQQIHAMKKGKLPHSFTKSETMWASFKRLWQPFILNDGFYYHNGYRFASWSWKHNIIVMASFSWLLLFLPFGLVYFYKYKKLAFYLIASVLLLHTFIHVVFIPFTEDRYRVPVDSLVIITAIAGMLNVFGVMKSYRLKKK